MGNVMSSRVKVTPRQHKLTHCGVQIPAPYLKGEKMSRDEFLTLKLGKCWHEFPSGLISGQYCIHCGKKLRNLDFSTWEGFGKLWTWAKEQEWWSRFAQQYSAYFYGTKPEIVNPDRFADAVAEYLKYKK